MDVYSIVNKAWKTTCRVLFKEEIGELKEYEGWLNEYLFMNAVEKDGVYVAKEYENAGKVLDYQEAIKIRNFEPLDINEIKDIDSIFEALKERFYYVGNVLLGNSQNVEKSTEVSDSFNVYESRTVYSSKNIAYSTFIRDCEYVFGSNGCSVSSFSVKNNFSGGESIARSFELFVAAGTSDVYYSSNIMYCNNIMFSFGIQNDSFYIGNIKLSKEKYFELKDKLIEEMRGELKSNKRLPSLADILSQPIEKGKELFSKIEVKKDNDIQNKDVIEKAFSSTTKIILKKELRNIDEYEEFLTKDLLDFLKYNISSISGNKVYVLPKLWFAEKFIHKCLEWEEVFSLGRVLTNNIKNFEESKRSEIYISYDVKGKHVNAIDCVCPFRSQDTYKCADPSVSKKTAFSTWIRDSQYTFGSFVVHRSSFSINASNSYKITRAFEVNSCNASGDIYFSHGLTNVNNAMFSFGRFGGSYLIGNVAYSYEQYNKFKESLLEQIANELEAKKDLKWSIYNIGR